MSEFGGLAYRFSGVQSSSQERSSGGNYIREKRVCTVSVNQWATNEEKQNEEKISVFRSTSSQDKANSIVLNLVQFV